MLHFLFNFVTVLTDNRNFAERFLDVINYLASEFWSVLLPS
jgi:hypothetical protein